MNWILVLLNYLVLLNMW